MDLSSLHSKTTYVTSQESVSLDRTWFIFRKQQGTEHARKGTQMCTTFWLENMKEKGNLEVLNSDRIILKCILNDTRGCGLGSFDSAQEQLSERKHGTERPGPIKSGKTNSATVRFSRRTLFREISVLGRHAFATLILGSFNMLPSSTPGFGRTTYSPTSYACPFKTEGTFYEQKRSVSGTYYVITQTSRRRQ